MIFVRISGVLLHYRLARAADAQAIALVNSPGSDARIWDGVIAILSTGYRVLSYDKRGLSTVSVAWVAATRTSTRRRHSSAGMNRMLVSSGLEEFGVQSMVSNNSRRRLKPPTHSSKLPDLSLWSECGAVRGSPCAIAAILASY